MTIDWSKAPEGFPLWLEGITLSQKLYNGWYRAAGEVFIGAKGGQWRANREGEFFIVHRNPDDECAHSEANRLGCPECGADFSRPRYVPPAWVDEGLPPVGVRCEGRVKNNKHWDQFEVVAIGREMLLILNTNGEEVPIRHKYWDFRPIRTAEQIEAEKRASAIDDMVSTALHQSYVITPAQAKIVFERIYDAGYRKQVQP